MCNVQQAEGDPRPSPAVCRSLFGPVDHAELSRELHSSLRAMEEESSRRWDFDFRRGIPLPSSSFIWEKSRGDKVPAFYRAPPRVRNTINAPESSDDPQPANNASHRCQASPNGTAPSACNNTQPTPNASQWCQPAPSACNITQPTPNASQWCQPASTACNITQPTPNASQWCQPAPSACNITQPTPSANTEPNRIQPATIPSSIAQTSSSASPEPNRTQLCKRTHPASHITGFFPVKKKSKVVKALRDQLHSRSPILTEHTPRKMLR